MLNVLYKVGIYSNIRYKTKLTNNLNECGQIKSKCYIDLCQAMGTAPPELHRLPQKQPRLILFVEVLMEKWALVLKRDSLAMRWRLPLGA